MKSSQQSATTQDNMHAGIVTAMDNDKITIQWDHGKSSAHDLQEFMPAPKAKASSQEHEEVQGSIAWMACSDEDNSRMAMQLTLTTLYQIYVSQSASHSDVLLTPSGGAASSQAEGPLQVWAAREFKPRSLVLLPFSSSITDAEPSSVKTCVPLLMQVQPAKEKRTSMRFWLKMRGHSKECLQRSACSASGAVGFKHMCSAIMCRHTMPESLLLPRWL